jgi:hypothetical protein
VHSSLQFFLYGSQSGSHPISAGLPSLVLETDDDMMLPETLPRGAAQSGRHGAGLRTETTINNSYDFGVGRLLGNLSKLREIGFAANRRMLEVEKASHDPRNRKCADFHGNAQS